MGTVPPIAWQSMPNDFYCPITCEIMSDPVVAADGRSYERSAIQQWLNNNVGTVVNSPMTGAPLAHRALIPNYNLRGAIEHAKAAGAPVTMPVSPTTNINYNFNRRSTAVDG